MAINESPLPVDESPYHVIPELLISQHGLSIVTTSDLTVRLVNRTGEIELSQRQFHMLVRFARHVMRHDDEDM